MRKYEIRDFYGNPHIQYCKEGQDTDGDMLSMVTYPNNISIANYPYTGYMPMDEFKREGYAVDSVVNYDKEGYTSVIIEEGRQ